MVMMVILMMIELYDDCGKVGDDDDDVMMMVMVVVVVGVLHVRPAGRWPLQDFIKTDCVSPGKRKSPFDELVEF